MWELNILWLLSPWLTNDDIERFITAAGLFAHHAAVVCHIAYPKAGNFVKDFNLFLDALSQPGKIKQSSTLPLSQLDACYVDIMTQITHGILPSAQLLLCRTVLGHN